MNEKRKEIIISEIKYWRQNKLLPSHYCDFLITLYAKGEHEEEVVEKKTKSIIQIEKKKRVQLLLILTILTIVSSVSMVLFSSDPLLPIGISFLVLGLLLYMSFRKNSVKSEMTLFIYILGAYLFFAITMKVWFSFFNENAMALIGLLILNCLLWIISGRLLKQIYLVITGVIGLLVILIFIAYSF
ncbi:hypothetical protein ACXYMX_06075 [Sporosarcina sp. CAU 1771]